MRNREPCPGTRGRCPAIGPWRSVFRFPFSVLLLALAGCASAPRTAPAPVDPLMTQWTQSAQQAFALRSYGRAAQFFELALQRARAMDDARQTADQSYNLAASLLLAGRPADALAYLSGAEGEYRRLRRDRGPALLLRARALRATGATDDARRALDELLILNSPHEVQCQGWLLVGQIEADAGRTDECAKALARARAFLTDDPALRAGVALLAGRLALLKGDPRNAALEFDKEAEFMRRAGRYADMAQALSRAGDAYAARGEAAAAANRHYRAARSWHGQGDAVNALRSVERALAQATGGEDPPWAAEVSELFEEIRRTPRAGTPAGTLE